MTACRRKDRPSLGGARGVTLVELMMVIIVMSVLVAAVAPRFRVSPSLQVQGAARQVAAQLEMARTHALGQRMRTLIVFDTAQGSYTAYVDHDRDGNITRSQTEIDAFPVFGARELGDLVVFGRGNASTVPGDTSLDPVTLTGPELDLGVQGVPEPWGTMGTIYLVHRDDPDAVSAISVASSGSFKARRWSQDAGEWQ